MNQRTVFCLFFVVVFIMFYVYSLLKLARGLEQDGIRLSPLSFSGSSFLFFLMRPFVN